MKKRVVIVLFLLLAAGGGLYLVLRGGRARPPLVTTSGIIEGIEVNLSPKFAGRIASLCCREGDTVKAGQSVATLENEDIRASLMQATAGVARAEADLKAAEASAESSRASVLSADADIRTGEADIEQALSRTEEARREMERAQTLFGKGFISRESTDQLITAHNTAASTYAAAQARLNGLTARKKASEAQLAASMSRIQASAAALREAGANRAFYQSRLNDMSITTPVSGTIVFKSMEQGETVSPGQTILTVVDLANRYVRADMDETKAAAIVLGSPAKVKAVGIPGKAFTGVVHEIGRHAEFATQRDVPRGRQDIRTFRVKVRVEDPEGLLKPGMTVDVEMQRRT
ncbi:MAG: efflux RND transporter periplasmic adaptor subunit [Nitrospiraceae bacterium]|nr:efflux RND transporter periplasmic adaptor subunit [Nitrospiraceae bacterium]